MLKLSQLLLTAASLSLATGLAFADVRYDFTATSSIAFQGETYTGSFSFVTPDFIVTDTTVPATSLLQRAVESSTGPVPCSESAFMFNLSPGYDTVGFGIYASDATPFVKIFYYFLDGAFSTPGLHASQLLGADQAGTLTVSLLSPVPEMASWAYTALGLAGLLAMVRRTRNQKQR